MEIILMIFLKEMLLNSEQFGHFGTTMVWCPLYFESALRFFYDFTQKKGPRGILIFFSLLLEKKSLLGKFDLF